VYHRSGAKLRGAKQHEDQRWRHQRAYQEQAPGSGDTCVATHHQECDQGANQGGWYQNQKPHHIARKPKPCIASEHIQT